MNLILKPLVTGTAPVLSIVVVGGGGVGVSAGVGVEVSDRSPCFSFNLKPVVLPLMPTGRMGTLVVGGMYLGIGFVRTLSDHRNLSRP